MARLQFVWASFGRQQIHGYFTGPSNAASFRSMRLLGLEVSEEENMASIVVIGICLSKKGSKSKKVICSSFYRYKNRKNLESPIFTGFSGGNGVFRG